MLTTCLNTQALFEIRLTKTNFSLPTCIFAVFVKLHHFFEQDSKYVAKVSRHNKIYQRICYMLTIAGGFFHLLPFLCRKRNNKPEDLILYVNKRKLSRKV